MNFSAIPVEVKIRIVGFLVGIAHVVAGISVWVAPNSLNVTQLHTFKTILEWFGYNQGILGGAILFFAGVMAVIGASDHHGISTRGWLFLPQQLLLFLQVWAIFWVFATGVYPDGYVPVGKGWFILSDQFLVWLMALTHSIWLTALIYGGQSAGRVGDS